MSLSTALYHTYHKPRLDGHPDPGKHREAEDSMESTNFRRLHFESEIDLKGTGLARSPRSSKKEERVQLQNLETRISTASNGSSVNPAEWPAYHCDSDQTSSGNVKGECQDSTLRRDRPSLFDNQDHSITSPQLVIDRVADTLPSMGQPLNFGVVVPGVYRSSFPLPEHYVFIKGLNLRTVVTLVHKEDSQNLYSSFMTTNGISHHIFKMQGTKKEDIPIKIMKSILRLVLDRQNHPLLIHCNHGKHRTGCVVAVVRKVSGWELSTVLNEYKRFAEPKVRECDLKYITSFEPASLSYSVFRATTAHIRARLFVRTVLFSFVITILWLISGSRLRNTKHGEETT